MFIVFCQKLFYISDDMEPPMPPLAEQILEYVAGRPEGTPIRAKGLLHLGSRAAVDQALSRLHRAGALLRIGRGVYVRPIEGRFGKRAPAPAKVVEGLSRSTGETIAPHGASAANGLGLSTQVPVRPIYLTSGRSRRLRLGKQSIELRHAPAWQLVLAGRPAGDVIRAAAWIGPKAASRTLNEVSRKLPPAELKALEAVREQLPDWLAREVSVVAAHA